MFREGDARGNAKDGGKFGRWAVGGVRVRIWVCLCEEGREAEIAMHIYYAGLSS